jgi:hypothetical protein
MKTNAHAHKEHLHNTVTETNDCDLRKRKMIRHTEHAVTWPLLILAGFINWKVTY